MTRGREGTRVAWLLVAGATVAVAAPAAERGGLFGLGRSIGGRGPVTVTAKTLEYDYKANVVVYRGDVEATQGNVRIQSDELTVRLVSADGSPPGADAEKVTLQEVIASGRVRIHQGSRRATGGRAVFDQEKRQLLLMDDPVLHDGPNEIAGDRVVVYLDEDRSVVEGGQGRVKAVLFPDADGGSGLGTGSR
jgi:lipopolysaccharide export system protein LptA